MIKEADGSKIWFTSDYHFGHKNIIKYCNRPFKDTEEMDAEIIRRHNEWVNEDDIVCCLGDISFHHSLEHLDKMNGTFMIVRGNHDDKNVKRVAQPNLVVVYKDIKMLCVHKPSHIFGNFKLNVVGHVHEKWIYRNDINALNVGVDVWDFRPVPLSEVIKYVK